MPLSQAELERWLAAVRLSRSYIAPTHCNRSVRVRQRGSGGAWRAGRGAQVEDGGAEPYLTDEDRARLMELYRSQAAANG
eukprot:SAG11_NODE_2203_length_3670_cov_62.164395_1_plen_80_part_00